MNLITKTNKMADWYEYHENRRIDKEIKQQFEDGEIEMEKNGYYAVERTNANGFPYMAYYDHKGDRVKKDVLIERLIEKNNSTAKRVNNLNAFVDFALSKMDDELKDECVEFAKKENLDIFKTNK